MEKLAPGANAEAVKKMVPPPVPPAPHSELAKTFWAETLSLNSKPLVMWGVIPMGRLGKTSDIALTPFKPCL